MMLHVNLICVGKLKEPFYIAACKEYEKRLSAFCKLQVMEIPEGKESQILSKISTRDYVIAFCIEGKLLGSPALAKSIDDIQHMGNPLTLLIGGSEGLPDEAKVRADFKLSMSPMTFPHHLARVMVLEQLYRGFMILGGSAYHK
jgi:Uncharacterized conserved protein